MNTKSNKMYEKTLLLCSLQTVGNSEKSSRSTLLKESKKKAQSKKQCGNEEKHEIDILECEWAAGLHAEGLYGVF